MPAKSFTRDSQANLAQPLIILMRERVMPRAVHEIEPRAGTQTMRGTFETAHEKTVPRRFLRNEIRFGSWLFAVHTKEDNQGSEAMMGFRRIPTERRRLIAPGNVRPDKFGSVCRLAASARLTFSSRA